MNRRRFHSTDPRLADLHRRIAAAAAKYEVDLTVPPPAERCPRSVDNLLATAKEAHSALMHFADTQYDAGILGGKDT